MSGPWLAIVGIGEDGWLSPEAAGLVAGAEVVFGGARHLDLAGSSIRGEARAWGSPFSVAPVVARRGRATAVLASGDPLWFGVGSVLLRDVPVQEVRVVPGVSAFALAAARLGWALQDVACLSCCGRPVSGLVPHLRDRGRLLVLSADAGTPAEIWALLEARGFGGSAMQVLEALGGAGERVRAWPVDDVGALNMVAVALRGPGLALSPLEDAAFEHDGQITKREVRAVTLAALAPRAGEFLWDVGAGAGSIGIEWMRLRPGCSAVAVERDAARAARVRRNAEALGVAGLTVIEGEAPGALAGLAAPDAVFVGGGVHRAGMIEACWGALRPGGRMVANAVSLPGEAALAAAQARWGGTLLRIGLERLDRVGGLPAFRPAMTVTQWAVVR